MSDRRWFCHTGEILTAPADTPLTLLHEYDRRVHRIWPDGFGSLSQVLTGCGKRGCVHRIGVVVPIDCPECLEGYRPEIAEEGTDA